MRRETPNSAMKSKLLGGFPAAEPSRTIRIEIAEASVAEDWTRGVGLIDAGFADRFEAFMEKAVPWLGEKVGAEKRTTQNVFARQQVFDWPPQLSLAADLFAHEIAPEQYPTLKTMLTQHCKLGDCPARLEWLGNTDVAGLTAVAVEFVRRNMARLIPSPGNMGGDYESAAGWLEAAREVAPETARRTLRDWQEEYKRRRNLWRDLRGYGFDV